MTKYRGCGELLFTALDTLRSLGGMVFIRPHPPSPPHPRLSFWIALAKRARYSLQLIFMHPPPRHFSLAVFRKLAQNVELGDPKQILAVVLRLCALVTDDRLPCSGVQGRVCECKEACDQMCCRNVSAVLETRQQYDTVSLENKRWQFYKDCWSFTWAKRWRVGTPQCLLSIMLERSQGKLACSESAHVLGLGHQWWPVTLSEGRGFGRGNILSNMISVAVVHLRPPVFSTLTGYHNSEKLKDVLRSDFWSEVTLSQGLLWVRASCIPELSNYGREPVLEVYEMCKAERMLWSLLQKKPL